MKPNWRGISIVLLGIVCGYFGHETASFWLILIGVLDLIP